MIKTLITILMIFVTGCETQKNKSYPFLYEYTEGLKKGVYINPITGVDSAGRTPDDAYYGGLSDYGTAGGREVSYATYNKYFNNRKLKGGDEIGINPSSLAGKHDPKTGAYVPLFLDNYVGPGDIMADMLGLGAGKQRDELIKEKIK